MRKLPLVLTILGTTALTAPVFAESHLMIVDEPLELTIHMHWPGRKVMAQAGTPA